MMNSAADTKFDNLTNCRLCGPRFSIAPQTIALTDHYLSFIADDEIRIFYKSIASFKLIESLAERRYTGSGTSGFIIVLYTKDFQIFELTLPNQNEARILLNKLDLFTNVDDILLQYPSNYNPDFPNAKPQKCVAVDDRADLIEALTTNHWRVSHVNENYAICPTYPEKVIVPAFVADSTLIECSSFRRNGRFCILVYYHRPRQTALLITAEASSGQNLPSTSTGSSLASSALNVFGLTASSLRSGPFSNINSPSSSVSTYSLSPSSSSSNLGTVSRSLADEQLLSAVLPNNYRGAILDVRDQAPSKKGPSQGLGESEPNYPQWRRLHRPIVPLTKLCKTFGKFIQVCMASSRVSRSSANPLGIQAIGTLSDSFNTMTLGHVESSLSHSNDSGDTPATNLGTESIPSERLVDFSASTGIGDSKAHKTKSVISWLTIVRDTLAAAVAGATALDARDAFAQQQYQQAQCILAQRYKEQSRQGSSNVREEPKLQGSFVIVQSCQGMDRALVVASLIQVILNPNARTFLGFQSLIEHTWLRTGHPFSSRCKHSVLSNRATSEEAPVFILFLDGVWQLWRQYPTAFEFNDSFLALLARHAYSSEFGTFLGNNERERQTLGLYEKTISLWSYIQQKTVRGQYMNPLYSGPHPDRDNYACWPSLAAQAIDIWTELYQIQQFTDPHSVWEKPREIACSITDQFRMQGERACQLRSILERLEKEAVSKGLLVQGVTE